MGACVGVGACVGTSVGVGVGGACVGVGIGVSVAVASGEGEGATLAVSLAMEVTRPLAWAEVSSATTPRTENNKSARLMATTPRARCIILVDFLCDFIKPPAQYLS